MKNNGLTPVGVAAIFEALKTNVGVVNIDLSYNDVGDAGAKVIGELLATNTAIYGISMGSCEVGDVGFASIFEGTVLVVSGTQSVVCARGMRRRRRRRTPSDPANL
jgi:hypothetical protein